MARRSRRPPLPSLLLRWLAVGGVVLIVFLYYRPLRAYFETRGDVAVRAAEVRALQIENRELEERLGRSGAGSSLVRQARRLGLVKPGEHLYIVKGIPEWRRARRAMLGGDG